MVFMYLQIKALKYFEKKIWTFLIKNNKRFKNEEVRGLTFDTFLLNLFVLVFINKILTTNVPLLNNCFVKDRRISSL